MSQKLSTLSLSAPQALVGPEKEPARPPLLLQRVQSGVSFFNERNSKNLKVLVLRFVLSYCVMGFFMMGIFSIYWGSMYKRDTRIGNLDMLVVIEDENGQVPAAIGDALRTVLEMPLAAALGNWDLVNATHFREEAGAHGRSVYGEAEHLVHLQQYWAMLYVPANALLNFYNAIVAGNTLYNATFSVYNYLETGRDYSGMLGYVNPSLIQVERRFMEQQMNITQRLLRGGQWNATQLLVASQSMEFFRVDGRPFDNWVLVAPVQVGLIYMIIVTFFAFNFFGEIHQLVAKMGIKRTHFLVYRVLLAILSFFFLSLFYSLVTLAFEVNFTKTFGRAGFVVFWMTNFLTMWAVGAMNEVMGMILIVYYPPLVGFWMLFWVISNISPTFSPMAVCPKFYRYGYGMPIHASYEITKVIFFDTYKGAMGRNYGVLVAWAAIATVLLAFTAPFFGKKMAQKAKAAKAQE